MIKPLHGFLDRDVLAGLREHADQLRRLQDELERALPPQFVFSCKVGNLKAGCLSLKAESGTVANRIKQFIPSLVAHFAQAGFPVDKIRVSVSVRDVEFKRVPAVSARTISDDAKANLERFAASLSGDSPLRVSVERLIRRSREK